MVVKKQSKGDLNCMNKIFSFEKDEDKLKIVVKNDGEVINTFVFNDTSISAEQIFNLF